ncbi:MAG TPA: SAM-dependent methyltransferase, partial [Acidimicrobiales bacterium]|nr:SAM-dependent methyltransferase [Acidimicrobiales bacterium]
MTGRIVVVGLGPAGPDLVTAGTLAALAGAPHRYLRTTRHPAASVAQGAPSFDSVYDAAETLDEVYATIAEALVAAAAEHGEIVYAVPGSPVVAERTVELLVEAERRGEVELDVRPALSFVDLAWARLRVDPVAVGARLVDGQRFAVEAAGERGPLLVAQCDRSGVLSDVKLSVEDGPDRVVVLQRLGLPDEAVFEVAWDDLDREVEPDHLPSLWVTELAAPVAQELVRFDELVVTLRRECPWDREQTHASLRRHLIEEAYETVEAIDGVDVEAGTGFEHLEEELGDLLFQVGFPPTPATEGGQVTLADG